MEIRLNDQYALDPVWFNQSLAGIGNTDAQWLDITKRKRLASLCNRFSIPSGGNPAYGFFAVTRKTVNALKDVDITLTMEVNDNVIEQSGLRLVRATSMVPVSPSRAENGDAFVAEIADKRYYGNHPYITGDTSAQKIFNIPAPLYGKDEYYTESLDPSLGPGLEVPWTWQGMLDEIWPDYLGDPPTLGTIYTANPVGFDFRAMTPYQALQVILTAINQSLKLNSDGSYSYVDFGSADATSYVNERLRQRYAGAIDESVEWIEPVSSYMPKGIKVHFHKTATNSGSENVFTKDDGQWFADLEHVITVNASSVQAAGQAAKLLSGYYHQVWDDLPAWTDPYSGTIENLADLQTRAQEVANHYYNNIFSARSRYHEVYSHLIQFEVCGTLQAVSWAQSLTRGGAWVTEIFAHPLMQVQFSGGEMIPAFIRPHAPWQWKAAPVYPPDTMLWKNNGLLTSGSSSGTQDDLYNGVEMRYNPQTQQFVEGIYVKGVPTA